MEETGTILGHPYVQWSHGQRVTFTEDPADLLGETVTVDPPRPRGYRGSHRRPGLVARVLGAKDGAR